MSEGFLVLILEFGIFTSMEITKDSFIAEYKGEFISKAEGDKRDEEYSEEDGCFLYLFDNYWYNLLY